MYPVNINMQNVGIPIKWGSLRLATLLRPMLRLNVDWPPISLFFFSLALFITFKERSSGPSIPWVVGGVAAPHPLPTRAMGCLPLACFNQAVRREAPHPQPAPHNEDERVSVRCKAKPAGAPAKGRQPTPAGQHGGGGLERLQHSASAEAESVSAEVAYHRKLDGFALSARTLGTLTGWQILAADVRQCEEDGQAAAAAGPGWGPSPARNRPTTDVASVRGSLDGNFSLLEQLEAALEEDQQGEQGEEESACSERKSPARGAAPSRSPGRVSFLPLPALAAPRVRAVGTPSSHLEREYEVVCELGRGAFGRALKARRRCTGSLVCIKVLDLGGLSSKDRAMVSLSTNYLPLFCLQTGCTQQS